jgi:plastocyanin domain-containing protein
MKNILLALVFVAPCFASAKGPSEKVVVEVTEKGFVPNSVEVKPGTDVTLEVTRKTEMTCATEVLVPAKKIKKLLPLNQPVTIALGSLAKGEIRFGCGMKMMESGRILVR